MKLYVKHEGELCELLTYQNTKSNVVIKSPSEGVLCKVPKKDIQVVGFRNGKGDTGELKILDA